MVARRSPDFLIFPSSISFRIGLINSRVEVPIALLMASIRIPFLLDASSLITLLPADTSWSADRRMRLPLVVLALTVAAFFALTGAAFFALTGAAAFFATGGRRPGAALRGRAPGPAEKLAAAWANAAAKTAITSSVNWVAMDRILVRSSSGLMGAEDSTVSAAVTSPKRLACMPPQDLTALSIPLSGLALSTAPCEEPGMRLSFDPGCCRFAADVRVRWADTDAARIAYNGAYLTWLEVARVEYFRTLAAFSRGLPLNDPLVQDGLLQAYPLSFSLASCAIEWRKPVRVDARLRLWIGVSRVNRRSLDQQYVVEALADGATVALAETTIVHVDSTTLRPADLPGVMRSEIAAFEAALERDGGLALVARLSSPP